MSQWLASDRTNRRGNDRNGSEMSALLKPDLAAPSHAPVNSNFAPAAHFQPHPPDQGGYAQRPPRKGSAGSYGSQLPNMPHPLLFHNGSYPPVTPFQQQPQYQQQHNPPSGNPHSPSGAQRRVPQPPSVNGIPPQSSRASVAISSFQFAPQGSFQPSPYTHNNQQQPHFDGGLDYGRKTPDPPKGSYRLHPNEVVHTHPPSAPPAQREKQRPMKGAQPVQPVPMQMLFDPKAPPNLGGVQGFNPSYNSDQRPPMHGGPSRQHQNNGPSSGFEMTNQYNNNNGPAPAQPRGSVQSTLASARGYSKLTVSQPQTQHALAIHSARVASNNSPSPNSTPVKPRNGYSAAMHRGSNVNGGGGNAYTSEGLGFGGGSLSANASPFPSPRGVVPPPSFVDQRRRAAAAPIPIALSWPNDNTNNNGGLVLSNNGSVTARGSGLRNSHPSNNGSSGSHNHAAPNFPSIMKRGAQLIETSPPVLTPEAGPRDSPPDIVDTDFEPLASDEDNWEDVALVDFADEEEQVRKSGGARVGSGARRKQREAAGVKKLDLSGAQSFRAPYHRKQFASKETSNGGGKTSRKPAGVDDVPPAAEWDSRDGALSDEEHGGDHKHQESKQQPSNDYGNSHDGSSNGGWILDVGMAENANPRFRASMEDAYVIRRKFGPSFPIATRKHSGASKEGADGENKESPGANDDTEQAQGSFFAIYDGHGGRTCVDFISRHFHREFARKLQGRGSADVPRAFEVAAQRVDAAMSPMTHIGVSHDEYQECGSTACMAYIRPCGPRNQNRELFMANIGDAQAVLAFDKSALTGSKKGANNENGESTSTDRNGSASHKKRRNHGGSIVGLHSNALASAASGVDSTRTPKKGRNPNHNGTPLTGAAAAVAAIAPTNSSSLAKTIARSGSGKPSERDGGATDKKKLSAIPLSYAHVASDAKEMARIKAAGGCVFANRVNGCLAVSRAFGDHSLKTAGVSCQPYQQYVELTSAHKYLIIGCDGVWDVLSFKQAVAAVAGMTNAQAMAQKLVDLSIKKGTTDNVSCMVIRFRQ